MGVDRLAVLEVDADDVGVAEQVVQVAEGFLIGTDEEDADVVGFVRASARGAAGRLATSSRSMKRSILPSQSQVMSASTARWRGSLVEPVDRHHREELVDRPGVGQRLEQREVAVVEIDERVGQFAQVLGDAVEFLRGAWRCG